MHVAWISAVDGSVEPIRSFRNRNAELGNAAASPGGGFVAFDLFPRHDDGGSRDIFIVTDEGTEVARMDGPSGMGVHRVIWDLRHSEPPQPDGAAEGGRGRGQARGPLVVPGAFTVRVSALGQTVEAGVEVRRGPMAVKTEDAFPVTTVFVDIEGRDLGSYVQEAQQVVASGLTLPPGYSLQWSGQWEFMQRVKQRLGLVVPVTIGIIFLLLYLNFRGVTESLLVMLSVPFALIGGVWYLWLAGYNTSVAVWVGFIALAGVAVEIGVVMLVYLNQAIRRHMAGAEAAGRALTRGDVQQAVIDGALLRVRPIMMTVAAIIAGLLPIMLGGGTGSEVMRRIAAPMVGGMVSATVLTLIVIPALFLLWRGRHAEITSP